jgi:hypothetical protein
MSTRVGEWDVYCSQYASGQWTQAQAVEPGAGLDINPSVSAGGTGDVWVAWQNLTSGNWDIHAKQMPLTACAERPGLVPRGFSVSPNPFRSGVTFRCHAGVSGVQILDATGRLVYSSSGPRGSSFRFDLRSLPAGVYVARVATAEGTLGQRILRLR